MTAPFTIWLDFEDIFAHAEHHPRPTGIQRMAIELAKSLLRVSPPGSVRFLRHHPGTGAFHEVAAADATAVYSELDAAAPPPPARIETATSTADTAPPARGLRHRIADLLPARLMPHAREAFRCAIGVPLALGHLLQAIGTERRHRRIAEAPHPAEFARGDVLLVIAAPWGVPGYTDRLRRMRDEQGLRVAVWIHDLIAMLYPEWTEPLAATTFRRWFEQIVPLCDIVLACSDAVLADIRAHLDDHAITPVPMLRKVLIGVGLNPGSDNLRRAVATDHLPRPGTYVLFVSTIEPRKNHALLLRVWRRLLRELPPAEVPTLVFAGGTGWLVEDLMKQLQNANYLDGHVMHVRTPSDGELAALYRGALFTLYPSFHEGWGSPVVESLAFGTPVIVANTSSLPESGSGLARFLDPDNLHDATAVIRAAITDRAGLDAWRAEVRASFRPVTWDETARDTWTALQDARR